MKGHRRDPERAEIRALRGRVALDDARILDVGCGEGRLARKMAGAARLVVGIDPNEALLDRARRLTPRRLRSKIEYRVGTAGRPGLARRRFDVAVFSGSL
jgi:2-polyprenyl-3-methyl-5-hydroxy-6-metoxy-1,4-benzoquinol methylase